MTTAEEVLDPRNIADRVIKGIVFAITRGFISKVDPDTVDVTQHDICMLGQAFGGYYKGLRELGISDDEATDLGFQCSAFVDLGVKHDESDWRKCPVYLLEQREMILLNTAFITAIKALRAGIPEILKTISSV